MPHFQRLHETYAAEDWPSVTNLIGRYWTALMFDKTTAPLLWESLQRMPEAILASNPKTALMGEGIGRLRPQSMKLTLPTTPEAVARTLANGSGREAVELALHRMLASAATGHLAEALQVLEDGRLLVQQSTNSRFGPATELASYWYLQSGHIRLLTGDFAGAHRDLTMGWDFRAYDVTDHAAASIAPYLALLSSLMRETEELARWNAIVDEFAERRASFMEWTTLERPRIVAQLFDAAQRLDLETGRALSHILETPLQIDEIWPFTLLALTQHWANTGDVGRASRLHATVEYLPGYEDAHGMHRSLVAIARADLACVCGRGNEAERALTDVTIPALRPLATLYAAHIHLLAGDYAATVRHTALAGRTNADSRIRGEARILGALAEYGLGAPGPLHRLAADPTAERLAARTLSLLPAELHGRLTADPLIDVPALNPLIGDAEGMGLVRFTPAEQRVLGALGEDGSLPDLAALLHISVNTLKSHLRSIYAKLGVASREEALRAALTLGLI